MPDREKVIKGLEGLRDICNAKSNMAIGKGKIAWAGYANAADDALALLKEQEAKPVIVTTNAYGTRFYHCPKCNRDLYIYPRQLYCSNCGQAVKWDG